VAIVNQWHVSGIEAHWRHSTNTEQNTEPINPIGDFNINAWQEQQSINDELRDIVSKITKSEPATWQNYITHYQKET
jgi:cell fate regulator YaaT (PSP1 superfamily)